MTDFWTRVANARTKEKEQREFVQGVLPERFDEYRNRGRQENLYFLFALLCVPALIAGFSFDNTLIVYASPIAFLAAIVKGLVASKAQTKVYEEPKRTRRSRERDTHQNVQVIREASALTLESLKELKGKVDYLTRELLQESLSRDPEIAGLKFDYFLSHAREDKEDIAEPLYAALTDLNVNVFYDRAALKAGDNLRRTIDRALSQSRFAIVVFSPNYISKAWPQHELDGLITLQLDGKTRIVPIWHRVSKSEMIAFSPTLANKIALNTSLLSVTEMANELRDILHTR